MILYKYVSHTAGMKILENNSLGFTQPCHFNDPFELEASYPSPNGNTFKDVIDDIRNWGKKSIWKENTGILSLTRQPLNPLMWAHYGAEHTGMVIGIDSSIEEFTCESTNLIPVQYGSVIYTNIKPIENFLSTPKKALEVGGTFHFPYDQLEKLQRTFLFKPMCWSYEEEVRVAKCLKGIETSKTIKSGTFTQVNIKDRPMYLLDLPKGAIKEVFVGVRSQTFENEHYAIFLETIKKMQPQVRVYGCKISSNSWSLESFNYDQISDILICT